MTRDEQALIAVNVAILALDHVSLSSVDGACDEATMMLLAARTMLGQGAWPELPNPHNDAASVRAWFEENAKSQKLLGLIT